MKEQEVVSIISSCLGQMINFDPDIDDSGREWWYVSPVYTDKKSALSVEEMKDIIKDLKFDSIKEVESFKIFDRTIIQIRGNRDEIIKECNQYNEMGEQVNSLGGVSSPAPVMRQNITVEEVSNGFVVVINWERHVAKDKAEALALVANVLK